MKPAAALIYTGTTLSTNHGKMAHGLIRGTNRFRILGVIDEKTGGKDAGEVLDGRHRNIPVFSDLETALKSLPEKPETCILGVATEGGYCPPHIREFIYSALKSGISIVGCWHELISDDREALRLAEENGVTITDIRKPKPFNELHFFTGDILEVKAPRIAVIGTDCALGKRTAGYMIRNLLIESGVRAEMIYTGQTGWLQGLEYGFILDATPNDFVSGELEYQVLQCSREKNPEIILLEGQSSLRNPSGPCGSEFLLSAQAEGVILLHNPKRLYFEPLGKKNWPLPSLETEIELIHLFGSDVLAIALNESDFNDPQEYVKWKHHYQRETGIPVCAPMSEGFEGLAEIVKSFVQEGPEYGN